MTHALTPVAAVPHRRAGLPAAGLVAAVLLLGACGGLDEVDVTRSANGTAPGANGAPPLAGGALAGLDVAIDRGVLAENDIDPDDVDSAKLVRLRLEVTQGTPFEAWLDSVSFFIEAPGLPRALLAQRSGIRALPAGTTTVDLDVPGVDLKPYALADDSTVTGEVSGTQPPVDTAVRATATIRVDVNVTGLFH
jgi:hypothetical protein